ncbi:hypothetical protein N8979_00665 [bacterium]|jgi:hypothetical protein|nr:hypothetical protein [bacterium]
MGKNTSDWTVAAILISLSFEAQAATASIECSGHYYAFESGLFGSSAKVMAGNDWQDFCVSAEPNTLTHKLIIRDDEVWCLTHHHITPESRAYARSTWMLHRTIGTLQVTDYVLVNGAWVKQRQERTRCSTPSE